MGRVTAQELAQWTAEARKNWSIPGIVVGLLQDGEPAVVADGVCSLGSDEQVTPETAFRVASITKPFTTTLAMTLVEDGLLALDAPPPGSPVEATIGQLLSHQGGLASEWPEAYKDLAAHEEGLERIIEGDPPRLPIGPGELFSYCNVGYRLVGAAAARAAGLTFHDAMRSRVIEPLGLRATGSEPLRAARGHDQVEPGSDEHVVVDHPNPRARTPSGGLWSTVDDLLRFAKHHLGGPGPLSRASIEEMQQPQIGTPGGSYGLGWFLRHSAGRRIVEHPGSAAGFQSLLFLVPDEGLAFAALTNSGRGSVAIRELLERLELEAPADSDLSLTTEELTRFAGIYSGNGVEVDVVPDHGHLSLRLTSYDPFSGESTPFPPVLARPVGEREFEIVESEWRGDRLTFPRDGFVCVGVLAARTQ
jgi:CubicO group peptidase (beta-lactamase class C family)